MIYTEDFFTDLQSPQVILAFEDLTNKSPEEAEVFFQSLFKAKGLHFRPTMFNYNVLSINKRTALVGHAASPVVTFCVQQYLNGQCRFDDLGGILWPRVGWEHEGEDGLPKEGSRNWLHTQVGYTVVDRKFHEVYDPTLISFTSDLIEYLWPCVLEDVQAEPSLRIVENFLNYAFNYPQSLDAVIFFQVDVEALAQKLQEASLLDEEEREEFVAFNFDFDFEAFNRDEFLEFGSGLQTKAKMFSELAAGQGKKVLVVTEDIIDYEIIKMFYKNPENLEPIEAKFICLKHHLNKACTEIGYRSYSI